MDVRDEASVATARQEVRAVGAALGLAAEVSERMAIVVSELGQNQLDHARRGELVIRRIARGGVAGLEVVASDRGPGISDPTRALGEAISTSGGLGSGLAGVLRLCDEVDFDVRWGEGTRVAARAFASPPPWKSEVAILGRPCAGEQTSGDDAAAVREGDRLVIAVADGLGHGPEARQASARAIAILDARAAAGPRAVLEACRGELRGTRGAVMGVCAIDPPARVVEHACVGDVRTHLYRPRAPLRFACAAGYLGAAEPVEPIRTERAPLAPGDVVAMFSDGLRKAATLAGEELLLRRHPLIVAHHLLVQFGRMNDDAIIVVAR